MLENYMKIPAETNLVQFINNNSYLALTILILKIYWAETHKNCKVNYISRGITSFFSFNKLKRL